jgi:hypothetical protein
MIVPYEDHIHRPPDLLDDAEQERDPIEPCPDCGSTLVEDESGTWCRHCAASEYHHHTRGGS